MRLMLPVQMDKKFCQINGGQMGDKGIKDKGRGLKADIVRKDFFKIASNMKL
jgi:hypothetical protein